MDVIDLRALEAAAAEGPWVAHHTAPDGEPYLVTTQGLRVIETESIADAALIAAARNALPYLLDVVDAAREVDEELEAAFVSWSADDRMILALRALDAHLRGDAP